MIDEIMVLRSIDFLTACMGIATFPKDGTTAAALMKSADLAMYEAKKNSAEWVHFDESVARPL